MGVVFPPNPEQNFDGKITIKRVSRSRQLQRDTYWTTKLHTDYHINKLIVDGDWRQVHDDDTYTANKILALFVAYYELDEEIAEALYMRYNTHDRGQGDRSTIMIRAQETILNQQQQIHHLRSNFLPVDKEDYWC